MGKDVRTLTMGADDTWCLLGSQRLRFDLAAWTGLFSSSQGPGLMRKKLTCDLSDGPLRSTTYLNVVSRAEF